MGAIFSRTSQARSSPAISRSEFDIDPFLLTLLILFCMSCGHFKRHTVGWSCVDPPNQTPPAPVLHASTYPMKCGSPGFSSRTEVGLEDSALIKVDQSCNACLSCLLIVITDGSPISAWLMGENKPLPLGMPNAAC